MKVSLNWLRQYVDIDVSVQRLSDALTMAGLEVSSVQDRYQYLETVKIARVLSVEKHPDAQRLTCCTVDAGNKTLNIVCGAPNVRKGGLYPLALVGTELPSGLKIRKSKIRGEISEGMLCSEKELGLGVDADGIMELADDFIPGTRLDHALNLSDKVLEIDLTPNRGDCLSVLGIAREISAIFKTKIRIPPCSDPARGEEIHGLASVEVLSPWHCPRYAARLIDNVTIAESPFWLADRLLSVGLRPINNVVDVTNFVMLELGQPLHAFDFDLLEGRSIIVRTARAGEQLKTLDGRERTLDQEMLLICDSEKPVAIAGVMGGFNSEISERTKRVLLESAYFRPESIRKTAKKLGMSTDASYRFERGVDPLGTVSALNRAAAILADIGAGTNRDGIIDQKKDHYSARKILVDVPRTCNFLGISFTSEEIVESLESLFFECNLKEPALIEVTPPSFRHDISLPEDIAEEIARLKGYDSIPTTFPAMTADVNPADPRIVLRQRIRNFLADLGFHETINYSFVSENLQDKLNVAPSRKTVRILNPISEDQTVMRTSLLHGLLQTAARNLSKQVDTIRIFETGKIFHGRGTETLPEEKNHIAALWTGYRCDTQLVKTRAKVDFYDLKGVCESLFKAFHVPGVIFTAAQKKDGYLQPGQAADILLSGNRIGRIGKIDPEIGKSYQLKQPVYTFEIDLDALIGAIPMEKRAEPLSRFPATDRDATIIVDFNLEANRIVEKVLEINHPLVEEAYLFDVFSGKPLKEDQKSVSLRIVYRSGTETLKDEKVNRIHNEIVKRIVSEFKARLPA